MSISSTSLSAASLIDTTPFAQTTSDATSFAVPDAAIVPATTNTAATTNDTNTLATDLAALLKGLADGNVSGSQTALTQLEKDLGVSDTSGSSSSAATPNSNASFATVLATISHLLSTGNTSGALQGLVGYLRQTASTNGNLFSTAA